MRVLIIGMHYSPEVTGNAPYTAGLAEALAARGDAVTVVTGLPHYPAWRLAHGTPRRLLRLEHLHGVSLIRAAHYVPATQSAMRRVLYEGTFGLTGLLATIGMQHPDAILGIVPNLSSGIVARLTGSRLGVPYGLLFQNLLGPGARQSGIAGGTTVAGLTAAAEVWAARGARAIGVVTDAFTTYLVSKGVPEQGISHVPNWTHVAPAALTVEATRDRFGWTDGKQVVLHAGNMGVMQGLEQVVVAARLAASRRDPIRFVLSGDGNQADAIRDLARDLDNLTFVCLQPDGVYASMLAAADVLLVSERETSIDMSLPSKLTSYFAAGRPIVAAVPRGGGSAREVGRSGAGIIVPAADPVRLLDALARLRAEPMLVSELAAAGPAYAATHTSATACLTRAVALVDAIAGAEPTRSTIGVAA